MKFRQMAILAIFFENKCSSLRSQYCINETFWVIFKQCASINMGQLFKKSRKQVFKAEPRFSIIWNLLRFFSAAYNQCSWIENRNVNKINKWTANARSTICGFQSSEWQIKVSACHQIRPHYHHKCSANSTSCHETLIDVKIGVLTSKVKKIYLYFQK